MHSLTIAHAPRYLSGVFLPMYCILIFIWVTQNAFSNLSKFSFFNEKDNKPIEEKMGGRTFLGFAALNMNGLQRRYHIKYDFTGLPTIDLLNFLNISDSSLFITYTWANNVILICCVILSTLPSVVVWLNTKVQGCSVCFQIKVNLERLK